MARGDQLILGKMLLSSLRQVIPWLIVPWQNIPCKVSRPNMRCLYTLEIP